MPPRSKIKQLPPEIKQWLDRSLIEGNFSGYELLEKELSERGFVIGKSSINRYGQEFEQRMHALKLATEQARAISEASPDNEGVMNDALIRLVQQKAFDALLKMGEGASIKDIGLTVSRLSNATLKQKQWAIEIRAKATAVADEVDAIGKKGGLSPAVMERIKRGILGIAE